MKIKFPKSGPHPYGKKLFGESLFKTIKNYSHYSPMLNWRTIGGTIETINYSLMLKEFLINFIENIQKKNCRIRNLFLTNILLLDVTRKWIPSNKFFFTYTGIRTHALPISLPTSHDATY